jgi:TRAP-type C4-dicarboxylate transport system substrate-binding protein
VLTPFKFYDAAKPVTEIHPSIVVSTLVVNKRWFDSLPGDVRGAITEAGAKVDREAYGFASALVERANKGWVDNGGQLLKLPAAEQAKMMADLKALGARILAEKPEVKAEYDELLKVAERAR